jgi:CheY-like chemotaxis protein
MAQVVAAIPDLMFRSRVLEAAQALSISVETARDADEVLQKIRAEKPRLVLLDLGAAALRPLDTLKSLGDLPVVGFLNHEHVELREQALAAGCGEVLTKGQFAAGLPQILRRVL